MADTPRMAALRNLSANLPVANSKVAASQAAARDIQLQQAVKAAPTAAPVTASAQQTGASAAQQAGSQMVERAQQGVQQQAQVGQLGLGEQARAGQARVAGLQAGAREAQMDNVSRLAQISEEAKQEMYDRTISFERDEAGRALFNERQLADYAKVAAQSDEELRNYAQQAKQLSDRNLQVMEAAYRKLSEDLTQKTLIAEQKNDQQTLREIQAAKQAAEERMRRERNKAANTAAMWQTGGTVAGTAVGAAFGGPAGAMAGGALGGAAGSMIGSQTA